VTAEREGRPAAGSFAAVAAGARWNFAGALTFAEAAGVYAASREMPLPRDGVVDCAGIAAVDSAAVAVLLALKRRAVGEGRTIIFANVPPSLVALARLYGVHTILAT
jgi:phospholipid transport system transporter-binding protein